MTLVPSKLFFPWISIFKTSASCFTCTLVFEPVAALVMRSNLQMVTTNRRFESFSISLSSFSLLSFCSPSFRVLNDYLTARHFHTLVPYHNETFGTHNNIYSLHIRTSVFTGLIIDAFGELRDQIEQVRADMESSCFICGIGKEYFDKSPHGFEKHVLNEHNFANYLCA